MHRIAPGFHVRQGLHSGRLPARVAIAALLAAATTLPAAAQDVVVSAGASQSNIAPAAYDSLEIVGTDGAGIPSTYDANAPLTVTGRIKAHDSGVFNANADVVTDRLETRTGGVVNLNAGTLSADGYLSFSGAGSVNRGGGTYSTAYLELLDGADLTYTTGDSIAVGAWVEGGGTLTLQDDLATSSYVVLKHGGSISRTTQTISTGAFGLHDATLDLIAGDSFFDPFGWNDVTQGGTLNAAAGTTLGGLLWIEGTNGSGGRSTFNVNGDTTAGEVYSYFGGVVSLNAGTLTTGWLGLNGPGAMQQTGGHYSTDGLGLHEDAEATYGEGDSITNLVVLGDRGTLSLDRDLVLGGRLYIAGDSATLVRNGHNYSVDTLYLEDSYSNPGVGASLTYGAGDSISRNVGLWSSTLTLEKDLVLSGQLELYSSVLVKNGHVFSADELRLNTDTTFTYGPGDSVTRKVHAWGNGTIELQRDLTLSDELILQGVAIVRNGHSITANNLDLGFGSTFTYSDGDSIARNITVGGATLELARDLSIGEGLYLFGPGSLVRNGHAIAVGNVVLYDGADLTYGPADSITTAVSVYNASFTLERDLQLSGMLTIGGSTTIDRNDHTVAVAELDLWFNSFTPQVGDTVASNLWVNPGSVLTIDHDLTITGVANAWGGGSISLDAGTLTAVTIVLEGLGSVQQHGGRYVTTTLALYGGAIASYGDGDGIDSLTIDGSGSELDALAPLALSSLSVTNGGRLMLASFTGLGGVSRWGLRLSGDRVSYLEALIEGNFLAGSGLLSVLYDSASDATFVTAVPEIDPAAAASVWALVVGSIGLLERRRGRRAPVPAGRPMLT